MPLVPLKQLATAFTLKVSRLCSDAVTRYRPPAFSSSIPVSAWAADSAPCGFVYGPSTNTGWLFVGSKASQIPNCIAWVLSRPASLRHVSGVGPETCAFGGMPPFGIGADIGPEDEGTEGEEGVEPAGEVAGRVVDGLVRLPFECDPCPVERG